MANIAASWNNATYKGRNDLVFENKNKEYGAFVIRREYSKAVNAAFIIAVSAFLLFIFVPMIINLISGKMEDALKNTRELEVVLKEPPPLDETEPPPPPPPPPPVLEQIKFTPPEVTEEEVPEEEVPPPQEELNETNVGEETQEGTNDGSLAPIEGTNEVVEDPGDQIFMVVEEMPDFPGGMQAVYKYIEKNMNYPMMEKEAGIQGKAHIQFVVDKEGNITDVKVLKGVSGGPGCDKEAVRVVKSMPKWKPGRQNGRAVKVYYNLPISFRLK